jgi:hypothetical protein
VWLELGGLLLSPCAETKGSHWGAEPAKGSQDGGWPPESQVKLPGPRPKTKKSRAKANKSARPAEVTFRRPDDLDASERTEYAVP